MISRGAAALLVLASSSSSSSAPPVGVIIHNNSSKSRRTTTASSHGRLTRRRTALQLAFAVVVASPFSSAQSQAASTTGTPYSLSRTLQLGLDANGKIRTCPSTNPGCVCTNPTVGASSSVASPLLIPEGITSAEAAAEMLRQAIIKTQKNVTFFKGEGEEGKGGEGRQYVYIQAEVDGGGLLFGRGGRDVMEFLVNMDAGVVAYRCVARDVTFVYPFTTAVGDSRGQEQRVAAVAQELGWEMAAETIYKERCIAVNDGDSWAKYMSISGSAEDEHDIITLQYTEEGLLTIDENRDGRAAAFGDDIAIECLATEFKREIFVVQAHGADAMVDEDNCVFFLPHRPRGEICEAPIFLFMKGTAWCGAGADHYEPLIATVLENVTPDKAAVVL